MAKDGNKSDQVLALIREMTILELKDLNDKIKEEFGVTVAAPVAMAGAPAAGGGGAASAAGPAEEEQTEFDVLLKDFGANKINVIKAVREVTTLGLKEAKDLVEAAPTKVKEGVDKAEAESVKAKLTDAGATVDIV